MDQENEVTVELTKEQIIAQINDYRDAIVDIALRDELSFDVVFNALAQTATSFIFDFLLLTQRELNDENVRAAVEKFSSQVTNIAKIGLENMREFAKAQAEEETPRIITES
jgi:hypothetical protein